jgi:hypothetical protein
MTWSANAIQCVRDVERSSQGNPLQSSTSCVGPSPITKQSVCLFVLQEGTTLVDGEGFIWSEA